MWRCKMRRVFLGFGECAKRGTAGGACESRVPGFSLWEARKASPVQEVYFAKVLLMRESEDVVVVASAVRRGSLIGMGVCLEQSKHDPGLLRQERCGS